jgi:hypothetical protein
MSAASRVHKPSLQNTPVALPTHPLTPPSPLPVQVPFSPVGLFVLFQRPTDGAIFLILYGTLAWYTPTTSHLDPFLTSTP